MTLRVNLVFRLTKRVYNLDFDDVDELIPDDHQSVFAEIDEWSSTLLYDAGPIGLLSYKYQLELGL